MELPSQTQAQGAALIGLLTRISGAPPSPPSHSLSARLAQWIEWRQAVTLASALDARPAPPTGGEIDPLAGGDAEYARVHAALVSTIESDRAFASAGATASTGTPTAPVDVVFYRQRYSVMQQVMEAEIRHLRGRLRARLTRHSGPMARLATIDAAMEQALAPRERALLAPLPELLGAHFERLRQAADPAPNAGATVGTRPLPSSATWLDLFRQDMQRLLLAELDLRMQPSQGLLAALRSQTPGHHGQ